MTPPPLTRDRARSGAYRTAPTPGRGSKDLGDTTPLPAHVAARVHFGRTSVPDPDPATDSAPDSTPNRAQPLKLLRHPPFNTPQTPAPEKPARGRYGLRTAPPFLGDLALESARCHELCGTSRRTLALMMARDLPGPVLWIAPGFEGTRLNPDGMGALINPGRLIFVNPRRSEDLLWVMEEALRAGAVSLVVAELPAPPGLTPVRRLHLAAQTGAEEGVYTPVGLILTPGAGGAPGVESRWQMEPAPPAGPAPTQTPPKSPQDAPPVWHLHRLHARGLPPQTWGVPALPQPY